jgi:hypothetical protein
MRYGVLGLILLAVVAGVTGYTAYATQTDASAGPMPRLSDGRPDLSGYWYRRQPPFNRFQKEGASVVFAAGGFAPEVLPGSPKYTPQVLARVQELKDKQVLLDPTLTCGPPGVPRIGPPQRIIHTTRELAILYDDVSGNFFRVMPTDGRPHPTTRPPNLTGATGDLPIEPTPHGTSVAHWEGDTLVIDVRNLSDDTWLGDNGLLHTKNTRVIERLTRKGNTLTWQAIVEDPEVLAEPWHLNPRVLTLRPGDDIDEAAFCEDRDLPLKTDLLYHGNIR